MAVSPKKKLSNKRYRDQRCMQISISPLKENGEMIKAAAAASGMSLQGYILAAVREKVARDSEGGIQSAEDKKEEG